MNLASHQSSLDKMVIVETKQWLLHMLWGTIFVFGILHQASSQTTVQYCGNTPADVVFLLDSSNSMWAPHFKQQLEFVINVTQMFQIGENATQVGLVTFNDDVQLQFYLNEYRDLTQLQRAIEKVQQTYGISTATDQALKFLRTQVFKTRYGARTGVPHIAIVITDGQSDHTLRTLIEATKARRQNINIFTIGVGTAVNKHELERMASSPSHEHAFVVDNFSFLDSIKMKLAVKTCLVTVPPTTVSPIVATTGSMHIADRMSTVKTHGIATTRVAAVTGVATTASSAIPTSARTTTAAESTTTTGESTPTTAESTTTTADSATTTEESTTTAGESTTTTTESTTPTVESTATSTSTTPSTAAPSTATSTAFPPSTASTTPLTTTASSTTTELPTTSTIPLPTTTTWVDVVRKICEKKPVDIVFALDSSDVVSSTDFWFQVKFVRDLTLGLDIGLNKTRIGVVIYSDKLVHVFDVSDHVSLSTALRDIYGIQRTSGGTRIDKVLYQVRTKSFRRTVSRREAAQLLILITASATNNLHRVKKEANKARKGGVSILVVGVGDKVNTEELSIIAGVNEYKQDKAADDFTPFFEPGPLRRRQIFHPKSFSDLDTIVMEATIEACTAEVVHVPVSDQACGRRQEADLMFVMDSESAGKKNTKKSLDFFKHVTVAMDVNQEAIQVGMIQPDHCIPPPESFRLNSHNDQQHVASALEQPNQDEKLSSLLKNMRTNGFKKNKGGRKEAKKVAVVLVDGDLQHPLKVLKEARRAQVRGIEVYIIFVGRDPPQPQVRDMCAYPPEKHFFQVPDYDTLKELEDNLIRLLCDEL